MINNIDIELTVNNLMDKTDDCNYVDGVVIAYDMLQKSNIDEQLRLKIFKIYCEDKAKCS